MWHSIPATTTRPPSKEATVIADLPAAEPGGGSGKPVRREVKVLTYFKVPHASQPGSATPQPLPQPLPPDVKVTAAPSPKLLSPLPCDTQVKSSEPFSQLRDAQA